MVNQLRLVLCGNEFPSFIRDVSVPSRPKTQGQLGNCWLMASLACLAEFDGSIMRCFETRQFNPRGRLTQTSPAPPPFVDCC